MPGVGTRTRALCRILEHQSDDATINQRFSAEQPSLASTRIVLYPPDEIERGGDCARCIARAEGGNAVAHIDPSSIITERACAASVSSDKSNRRETERRKPLRFLAVKMQRGGPDGALIAQYVDEELFFKRWCWGWRRFRPSRRDCG